MSEYLVVELSVGLVDMRLTVSGPLPAALNADAWAPAVCAMCHLAEAFLLPDTDTTSSDSDAASRPVARSAPTSVRSR